MISLSIVWCLPKVLCLVWNICVGCYNVISVCEARSELEECGSQHPVRCQHHLPVLAWACSPDQPWPAWTTELSPSRRLRTTTTPSSTSRWRRQVGRGFCIEIMNCLRCRCLWWWVRCERDKNYFDAVKDQDIERYLNEVEIEGITKEQDEEIMKIKQRQVRVPNKRTQDISDDWTVDVSRRCRGDRGHDSGDSAGSVCSPAQGSNLRR